MAQLSIRIDFEQGALGPGMAELLERIAASGSIRQAAAGMDMSYRKAWLLIQAMEETFGDVLVTATGGATGGGARLTELGNTLLKSYRRVEARAAKSVDPELRALSALVKKRSAPGRYQRKKRQRKDAESAS